jgi:hypothetical protein
MDMYVDGVGDTYGVNSAQSSGPVNQIGRNWGGSFLGAIDQVKIYNYARTPAQIAYDYNKGAPIAWFKFDECQGNIVNNSSSIGITGIINIGSGGSQNTLGTCAVGTSAAWTNGAIGKINSSLTFDGVDDHIYAGNYNIYNLAITNHTFSLWFKTTGYSDNPSMMLQRYTGGSPGAGYWLAINSSNRAYYENRADGGDHLSIQSSLSYNDSKWHHLLVVVDVANKNAKMYVDTKLAGSDTYLGNLLNNNNLLSFGGQGTGYNYSGQLDDVRIYNYALTYEQIKNVYNNGAIYFN